jgi:hypothetical protein
MCYETFETAGRFLSVTDRPMFLKYAYSSRPDAPPYQIFQLRSE